VVKRTKESLPMPEPNWNFWAVSSYQLKLKR